MSYPRYSRWAVVIIILAVLLAAVWVRSFAQGNDIPYGQSVTGSIKSGVTDTWHFIGTTGDLIVITVERTSENLEPVLTLQNPAQQSVAGNQADKGQGKASLTQVRLAHSGSYLIQVAGNNNTIGDYKLTLTLLEATSQTPTPEPTAANRVVAARLSPGSKVRGELDRGLYRQFWSFRGSFGDIVDIRMIRLSGNLDSALSLISPIEDVVAVNNSESGGPDAGILGFQLPYTGEYTIVARREGENSGELGTTSGTYELTFSSRGSGDVAGNTALQPNATMIGRLSSNLPNALYRLDIGGTVALNLDLGSLHRAARIRIRNTSGELLLTEEGTSPLLISARLPEKGPFLVEATSLPYELNATSDFGLTMYRLSANAAKAERLPDAIRYGERRVASVKGSDNWLFRGRKGDIISVDVTPNSLQAGARVRVTSPNDVLLYQGDLGAGLHQTFTLTEDGIYEIEVRPEDETVILPYELHLNRLGADENPFGLYGLPVDRGTASLSTPIAGKLQPGAADAWWLDASAGQVMNLTVLPLTRDLSLGLALRGPDGTLIDIQISDRVSGAVIQEAVLNQTGRYRVEVFDSTGSRGGDYTLRLEESNGGILEVGKVVKGIALPTNGYSIWKIDVVAGTLINARLTSLTPQSWKPTIHVAMPGGRIISSKTVDNGAEIDLLGVEAPVSGTYSLAVGGQVVTSFASYTLLANLQSPFGANNASQVNVSVTGSPVMRYAQPSSDAPIRVPVADLISPSFTGSDPANVVIPNIATGSTVRGEIAPGAFTQVWQLGTIEKQTIAITATSLSSSIGPDLTLVNSEGKVVHKQLHADDSTTYLTYTVVKGGPHRLVVRTGLSGGRYLITLNTIPVTQGDARVLTGNPIIYGQTRSGEILSASPIERYYFVGTANDVASIRLVRSTGNLLASIQLFSPDGTEVARDRNTENVATLSILDYRLEDSGVYTLLVQRSDNGALTSGAYFLSLSLEGGFKLSNRGGGLISSGQTVTGQLELPDNQDTWLFQGRSGQRVTFELTGVSDPTPAPLGLRLQDTAGQTIAAQDITLTQGAIKLRNIMLPADGVYRVQVVGATTTAGLYALTWKPDEERLSVGTLRYNQTVTGVFRTGDNTDTWVLSGTEGDVVSISLEYERGTKFNGGFQIVSENGLPLATVADIGNGLGARIENLLLPFSGSYTLYVANPDTNYQGAGVYSLSVDLQESKARSIGSILRYGQQGAGDIYLDDPLDTWIFSARAGDTVKLTVQARDQFLKPLLELRQPTGALLASAQSAISDQVGRAVITEFRITVDSIYVVNVSNGESKTTGSYLLSLDYTPPPLPENAAIAYGGSREGLIADNRPRQLYLFSGREGDMVVARAARESGANLALVMSIETLDGQILASANANGADSVTIPDFRLPRTGEYFLVVSRYLGARGKTIGRFTVNLAGTPPDRPIKGTVGYNQQAIGRLNDENPVERITFQGKTGDVIGVVSRATSGDLDTQLTLENSAGVVLAGNDDGAGTNAVIAGTLLTADDTYTVTISRVGTRTVGSSGNYELFVNLLYQVSPTTVPQNLIAYGQRIVGSIDPARPEVGYTFSAKQGDEIAVQLVHQMDDAPPQLSIQDPAKTIFAQGQLENGQTTIERYRIPVDGLYTVVVKRPLDATQRFNPYALTLTLLGVGGEESSSGGVLNLSDSVLGDFRAGTAAQYWLFEGKAGQVITLNLVEVAGDLNPTVILVSPNGTGLTSISTVERQASASLQQFNLPADGVYTILVLPGTANSSGQYRLTLQPNNASPIGIPRLTNGQTVSGTISEIQPEQRWLIRGLKGESIAARLLVTGGTLNPRLKLSTTAGQVVAEGLTEKTDSLLSVGLTTTLPADGEYILVAYDQTGPIETAGTYRLSLEVGTLSPQVVASRLIAYGQPVSKVTQQGAMDYWSFIGNAGDAVSLSVAVSEEGNVPTITLQDQSGQVLAQSAAAKGQTDSNIPTVILSKSGRYVVVVEAQSTLSYTLVVHRHQQLLIKDAPARILVPEQALEGALTNGDPVDYWTIDAKLGDVLQLDGVRLNGDVRIELALFSPSSAHLASGIADPVGGNSRLGPIRVAENGKYMLIVTRWLGAASRAAGRYALTLTKPTNVSGSAGGHIAIYGQVVTGGITSEDATDEWTFQGNAGDVIDIRAERLDGNIVPTLTLNTQAGEIATSEVSSSDQAETVLTRIMLPSTGTYTLVVGRNGDTSGGYSLILEQVETANQALITSAEGITYGESKTGELTQAKPALAYVFFSRAGERVTIEASPAANSNLDPAINLIAPDGSILSADDNSGGDRNAVISSSLLTQDGFYGIVISGSPLRQVEQLYGAFTVTLNRSQAGAAYQGKLTVGAATQGVLTTDQPVQEWIFYANTAKTIAARIESPAATFNVSLSVVGQDGQLLMSSAERNAAIETVLPGAGWYAVLVSANAEGAEGSYDLEVDYALAPTGGGLVVSGQTVTGTINNEDFTDTWHIDAEAGALLDVNLTRISGDLDVEIAFYAPDGSQISLEGKEADTFKLEGFKVPENGTYKLMVSRVSGASGRTSGDYEMRISLK